MEHYIHTRKPHFIFKELPKDDYRKKCAADYKLAERNEEKVVIVAPLNANLTGWSRLAKRC